MEGNHSQSRQPSPAASGPGTGAHATPNPSAAAAMHPSVFSGSPLRNASLRMEHTPTQSQLTWPSVHRSLSSAATRDSSRRSEGAGGGGRRLGSARSNRPGSVSLGNSTTASAVAGSRRQGLGDAVRTSAAGIPLLVDVAEMGSVAATSGAAGANHNNNDAGSTAHSHATTALCTPREMTASPPLEELETEADAMSREELIAAVETLRRENLVIRTGIIRDREAYAALREGMRESYTSVERKQESITNILMRRLDAAKRVKAHLAASLATVEEEKNREEIRLQVMQRNIARLTRHLKREEGVVGSHMQEQLQYLQTQRDKLKRLVDEQSDSLQQLEELVNEMQGMEADGGAGGTPSAPPSRRDSTLSKSSSNATAGATATTATTTHTISTTNTTTAAASAAPAAALVLSAPPLSASDAHQRTCSQLSASASMSTAATTGTGAGSPSDVAYSPRAMVGYLEQEIRSVEALRAEVLQRAETYAEKCRHLEERVARELRTRQHHQRQVEGIKQELNETSTAVKELSVQQELLQEVESERRLNAAVRCDSQSRATNPSSAVNTPKAVCLSDAMLMPTSAKYVNPNAVDAFRMSALPGSAAAATAAAGAGTSGHNGQHSDGTTAIGNSSRPTASVNLADVVLLPGIEKYAIPAERISALTTPGTSSGSFTVEAHVPVSLRPVQATASTHGTSCSHASENAIALQTADTSAGTKAGAGVFGGPSIFDALLAPGAERYTLAVDPRNAVATGLLQQMRPTPVPTAASSSAAAIQTAAMRTQSSSSCRCASDRAEEGTPKHSTQRISVQHTTRMTPPRPLSSAEGTPRKSSSMAASGNPPALDLDGH